MRVYESDVPDVGRKFELGLGDASVVVGVHHDGVNCSAATAPTPTPRGAST